MLGLIGKGLIIGVLVSAPMGPVGILCIQRTLNKGRWYGFLTGMGAMFSDMIYAAVTCLGMGVVVSFVEHNRSILQLSGSVVLALFGGYIYNSNPVRKLKQRCEEKISYMHGCITGFLLTFSNVLIILLYIGLFAQFGLVIQEYPVGALMGGIGCIGLGAVIWWFSITYLISKIERWFNIRSIWVFNKVVGVVILLLATAGIVSAVHCLIIKC
ncbi:MAG: LysE family transporter [Bacteroidales bacterium]